MILDLYTWDFPILRPENPKNQVVKNRYSYTKLDFKQIFGQKLSFLDSHMRFPNFTSQTAHFEEKQTHKLANYFTLMKMSLL